MEINLIDRYFTNRHTVRDFTDREVTPEMLDHLFTEAAHAPNTGNMQLYSVIVTRTKEGKEALAPAHFNQPCVTGCSVLLTFCIDIHRFEEWCRNRNADCGFNNQQMLLASAIDAALFAEQFNTLAEIHGMGGCFLGTTLYNAPEIADILRLPKGVVPLIALALGYPATEGAPSPRLPLRAIVHDEVYHDFTPADIDEIYRSQESEPSAAAFIAENSKDTLAQVFSEVRYPRESNELFSKKLTEWLDSSFFSK